MVPSSIRSNLGGLRRRERLLTFVWGAARWLAIGLALLLLCGFVDWLIDRDRDTPMAVRVAFLALQLGVAAIAGFWLILWPQIRRLPDETLALWVEAKLPRFDHRLISAVQLNQPDARLDGMSPELVTVVTREAEKEAQRVTFARVADHGRFVWSAGILAPAMLIFLVPFVVFPDISLTLLARQGLADVEIPRSVYLENVSEPVWPVGEEIPIRYRVTGKYTKEMTGAVSMSPGGRVELHYIGEDEDGAIFGADVDPAKVPSAEALRFSARLADGRTRAASDMQLVPRPVITDNLAWIILPEFVGKNSEGARFERPQGRGDVAGIPGSSVRVQFETQRPIKKAWIEVLGYENPDVKKSPDIVPFKEISKGKLELPVAKFTREVAQGKEPIEVWCAETIFDLIEGLSGYRMIVEDEHGFDNVPKPRRALRVIAEEPPQVVLLKDTFDLGAGSSFDLEGLPVRLGYSIRIPYRCDGPYGLSKARVLYRVLKKHESGEEPPMEEEWSKLEMPDFKMRPGLGEFDPNRGVFEEMQFNEQVSFHKMRAREPGRMIGGGRYFLETKGNALLDSKSQPLKLKAGDQIEYCVEVFAAEREPRASIPSARSETRVAIVMDEKEFANWVNLVSQEDARVRELETKQKGIFERK